MIGFGNLPKERNKHSLVVRPCFNPVVMLSKVTVEVNLKITFFTLTITPMMIIAC